MDVFEHPSINHGPRPTGTTIDTVVLHATGGPLEPSINWLCNPASGVSAHYVVAKNGRIFQCVAEARRAWHAGRSRMSDADEAPGDQRGGRPDVNDFSIGIEIVNANDGRDPYPAAQIDALIWLLSDIRSRHPVPLSNITTHAAVALPAGRKTDPAGLDVEAVVQQVAAAQTAGHLPNDQQGAQRRSQGQELEGKPDKPDTPQED